MTFNNWLCKLSLLDGWMEFIGHLDWSLADYNLQQKLERLAQAIYNWQTDT